MWPQSSEAAVSGTRILNETRENEGHCRLGNARIVHVFEVVAGLVEQLPDWEDLTSLDVTALARLAEWNHAELIARENRVLLLACAWADAHPGDPLLSGVDVSMERPVRLGGDGAPDVAEYACAEFGAVQGKSTVAARDLLADALDIRHRLPELWQLVVRNAVRAWQARRVAEATRALSLEAAAEVDHVVATFIGQVGWARFERLLEAAVCDADPEFAAQRAERARMARGVWSGKAEDGQKTIFARTDSGTVAWFMGTLDRIAEILQVEGDTDDADLRRAKSIGVLAQPAKALQLLVDHDGDLPAPDMPVEPIAAVDRDLDSDQPVGQSVLDRSDDRVDEHIDLGIDDSSDHRHVSLDLARPEGGQWHAAAARPRVVLHFHLSDQTVAAGVGVVRPEHGEPITLQQLREFLAGTGCHVRVQPVIDPACAAPVDGYEIPLRLRSAVRYRDVAEVFPWGTCVSPSMDLDHSIPYQRGGPPGQTGLANLAPLSRGGHRAKTVARWQLRQPGPGTYLWRSPHGWIFLVTNQGTMPLGNTAYGHALWRLAASQAVA